LTEFCGATATSKYAMEIAIHEMTHVKAKIKFLSIEPLLADMGKYDEQPLKELRIYNWVIIGAQTKPYKPPKIEWVQEVLVACHNADIPVFMKNNLQPLLDKSLGWEFWKLRQEMPGQDW